MSNGNFIKVKNKNENKSKRSEYLFGFFVVNFAAVAGNECVHIEFALASLVVHETYFAENGSFAPALIMNATNRPHTTCTELEPK